MFDATLVDEWVFTPSTIRFTRSLRVIVVAGLALVSLAAVFALRSGASPATDESRVLGISEVRSVAERQTVRATASFEIVHGEMDGSAIVDMTLDKVPSKDALGLRGSTLRLDVAPGGRLVSLTGLGERFTLEPTTGAPALMNALGGQRVVTSNRWTAPVELRLVVS